MSSPTSPSRPKAAVEGFFRLMLHAEFPRLMDHPVHVLVDDAADHLFVVQPYRTGVAIVFSNATAGRRDLARVVREAGLSAERHLHGLTAATRTQLDALDWWIYHQRQLPCSD